MSEELVSVDPSGHVEVEPGTPRRPGDTLRARRTDAGRAVYWALKHVLLGPAITKVFRPVEEGADQVPRRGPAILASNHLSFADWLFMPLALDRRVTFAAKSDYFTGVGLKGWAQKRFFAGTGQVPVDRRGGRAGEAALRAGLKVLQRGELFGIYPEGTRSHDGRLYKGRTGVARLALLAQVPVVPSAVIGTDIIAPAGQDHHQDRQPDGPLRAPARLLPLRRVERGPLRPALDHRRDHVRDHGAVRPGVRRPVRADRKGAGGTGGQSPGGRRGVPASVS